MSCSQPPFHSRLRRRETLLIVGCGDVGLRVARTLGGRLRLVALTSSPERREGLRGAGVRPLVADLDRPESLERFAGLASRLLYLAPPPAAGTTDPRLARLLRVVGRGPGPTRFVYASTSGVYGDCAGARIDETRAVAPASPRAMRRVDAERQLRALGRLRRLRPSILRIPGIYALDREGGDPRDRLRRAAPVLAEADDVYTNHIHADDLARICIAALVRGAPQRVYHASDDTELRMGDYFDLAADLFGLPRPPRIPAARAAQVFTPMQLSFMSESRRLDNRRLKRELRVRLAFPTVREGLAAPR